MTKQVAFDILLPMLTGLNVLPGPGPAFPLLFAAAGAAILSCLASHPGDLLVTAVNKMSRDDNVDGVKSTAASAGLLAVARALYRRDGWRGLTKGLKTRLLHVGTVVTVQLSIYDLVRNAIVAAP